jgi:putative tricarboxylic transport membrane protein
VGGKRQQSTHAETDTSSPAAGGSSWLHGDDVAGVVILVFVGVVVAITTTFEEVPVALSQGIPPEQFPRMLGAVIALLAITMIVQSRLRQEARRKPAPMMVLATACLLLIFVLLIDWIGMISAMFVFCLALPMLWGERRFLWIGVYAVLFPACIYLLFSVLLGVRLPLGLFSG